MSKSGIKVWAIEQREPLGPGFEFHGIKIGTEAEAIAECAALLVENGGGSVEARFRNTASLGRVWRYIPQWVEDRPEPTDSGLDQEWPDWLSPESEYTEAGAEALARRRRARFSRFVKKCDYCGAEFGAKTSRARFCSARCRQAAYRARNSKPAPTPVDRAEAAQKGIATKKAQSLELLCSHCGDIFYIDGTQTGSLYCSARCRQEAYRARKKADRISAEREFLSRCADREAAERFAQRIGDRGAR